MQIAGRGNVPADAVGVELNITAIQNEGRGFATLYPCTATPPTASTLNYMPGVNIANATTVALNSSGEVCVYTSTTSHYALDVVAHITPSAIPPTSSTTTTTTEPPAPEVYRMYTESFFGSAPTQLAADGSLVVMPRVRGYRLQSSPSSSMARRVRISILCRKACPPLRFRPPAAMYSSRTAPASISCSRCHPAPLRA